MNDHEWQPRLSAALAADDRRAAWQVLEATRADRDQRDVALNIVAAVAADGSELATELLVEMVDKLRLAHRGVARMLVDEDAIDDVAQDTLVAVASNISSFRGDAKFTTWLINIARNRAVDHLRRSKATEPLEENDMGDAQRISSIIATQETARNLVARLDNPYRDAVILRDLERLTYAEASERQGVTVNTMKSRVARGRAHLARMLTPRG